LRCLFCLLLVTLIASCTTRNPAQRADSSTPPPSKDGQPPNPEAGGDGAPPQGDGPATDGAPQSTDAGATCGDGVKEGGEQCDLGPLNSDLPDAPCRPDCKLPRCGDGVQDSGEGCDDGNAVAGDGCSSACKLEQGTGLVALPAAVSFGALGLGCDGPRTLQLALVNPTTSGITVSKVTTAGCPPEVKVVAGVPATVAPQKSHPVQITFTPTTQGLVSCALTVTASDGTLSIPVTAQVSPKTTQTDLFLQKLNRKVDILFVIDPSGSMMDEKARLIATAPAFAQAASQNKLDFHLGSISLAKPYASGNASPIGVLHGDPRYITPSTPALPAEFKERIDIPMGGGTEVGMDAIIAALSPPLTSTVSPSCSACPQPGLCLGGACRGANWGFRRAGASLDLLVFTDEDDGSTATPKATRAFLQAQVNPLVGQFVRVHGLLPSAACQPNVSFDKWKTLITTTGGSMGDLCAQSYVPTIQNLASRVFGLQDQFYLSRPADAASFKVTVDGKLEGNFKYDATSNSINFGTPPPDGATIVISYSVVCK
jgi:cysteine-rich repeat protein